jgi:hypothetical protein
MTGASTCLCSIAVFAEPIRACQSSQPAIIDGSDRFAETKQPDKQLTGLQTTSATGCMSISKVSRNFDVMT